MTWTVYNGGEQVEFHMPVWGWPLILVNAIILLPISFFINYTLFHIYPVFTIIEDENPLPTNPFPPAEMELTRRPLLALPPSLLMAPPAHNARGFMCAFTQSVLTGIVASIFSWGPVKPFAELLASLVMVQFATAWRAFDATWKAIVIYWAATQVHKWVPYLLAVLIGFDAPTMDNLKSGGANDALRDGDISYLIKATVYILLSTMLYVVVIIPARVVVVRIQASLLPEDEDPIIPFDRSFDGKVEPAVVGGLGYATISDAWSTFSKAAWRRVVILYVKIVGIFAFVSLLSWAILLPTCLAIIKAGSKST
ncbi:hypothetical protein TrVFT333_001598 [Trichoderma virens FT-333]|nr:hypothetical protein TrVFT333_001598 [Trichoderma virens FT-333]